MGKHLLEFRANFPPRLNSSSELPAYKKPKAALPVKNMERLQPSKIPTNKAAFVSYSII
jgi:hypothetical protein